ncbi:Ig-like domain-containing protein, partial [Sunxiuqinia sp. A32]|uniref:Ig-like domain-containing protein n=1 Tax=Sunxiuqinia sp. A32 TaxID=3461496 RepID=UPI0040468856
VIVDDTTAPVADVASLPDLTGECGVTVSAAPTANDNCSGLITGTTTDPLTYNSQGTYFITWTYDDGNGNSIDQVQTVIVDDTTPPVITCPGNIIRTTSPGVCEMDIPIQNAVATDNCSASVVGVRDDNQSLSDPYPAGITRITWTATDIGDNEVVCVQIITVKSPPVAVDDEVDSFEDTPASWDVLDNDVDCDDNLSANTLQIIVPPMHGTATANSDGTIDFISDGNYHGYDELTYRVCDDDGLCDNAMVTIRVGPVNDPPEAVDDYFIRTDDTANILDNDSDLDGDGIILNTTPISGPYHGSVTLNPDGTFVYTPDDFYFEKDSFIYEICDDYVEPLCDQAQVVLVNDMDDDGIDDLTDIDDDNDGIRDINEGDRTIDSDNDGIPDSLDIDSDDDGIPDNMEGQRKETYHMPLGTDGDLDGWDDAYDPDNSGTPMDLPDSDSDGMADFIDTDSDDDSVVDNIEAYDFDFDGEAEVEASGDDVNVDGLDDGYSSELITVDLLKDFDGDGVDNWRDADDDNDGLATYTETVNIVDTDNDGLVNYMDVDSDDDGILDNVEGQSSSTYISMRNLDSDGDGLDDAYDPDNSGQMIEVVDTDGDGVPDYMDEDSDDDLVPDFIEAQDIDQNGEEDMAFTNLDEDGNGLDDLFETYTPPLQDSNGDGVPDWRDPDDDGDSILTLDEDENGDGDPTNDDCNWNDIPNYLDPESCELLIPDAFSPNGDGINDYLRIRGIHSYPNASIEIYNRWGVKVYENDDYGNVPKYGDPAAWWDGRANINGTSKGEILPAGTYFIIVVLDNSSVHKGFVYLNR